MADATHLHILEQGVEIWNAWRRENAGITPDLSDAKLGWMNLRLADLSGVDMDRADLGKINVSEADLFGANLRGVYLREAHLHAANLVGADLREADLSRADLSAAQLSEADLAGCHLQAANLSGADLAGADLSRADLQMTNLTATILSTAHLSSANLSGATLRDASLIWANVSRANFTGADLNGADLSSAICGFTTFNDVDLSTVKGLETLDHQAASYIDIQTLFRSQGKIPDVFLRGCGVPDMLITYLASMLDETIQFYSCFISYSHADKDFARHLYDRLQGEGIRCWLDEHQLNPGDPLHPTIYEAIRVYDKVILCCSKASLTSWWVEKEFTRALRKEEDFKTHLIVPLNLDGYVFEPGGWLHDEIRQRMVADFTGWKNYDTFEQAVQAVIRALRTDGGKEPPPEPRLKPKR
jgi:uncharacterized protein YjbI with pentapeptide repeats